MLVVVELSLSAVLLIGAGLLLHSFYLVQRVDPGFNPRHVLSFMLPASRNYPDARANVGFYNQLEERLADIPGVESIGGVSFLPLAAGDSFGPVLVEGRMPAPGEPEFKAHDRTVLWDYFETMGIPLRAGRFFNEHDTEASLPVAIVDEAFAKRFGPVEGALGKRIRHALPGAGARWLMIVGVVGTVKHSDLESDAQSTFYQPLLTVGRPLDVPGGIEFVRSRPAVGDDRAGNLEDR